MKRYLLLLLVPLLALGYRIETEEWQSGYTFGEFLHDHNLSYDLYLQLPNQIKRALRTIPTGAQVYLLMNNSQIKQALIPLGKDKQLQIIRTEDRYIAKVIPIKYDLELKKVSVPIENSLSYDLYEKAKTNRVALEFQKIFRHKVDFYKLPKGTEVQVVYRQKSRFGEVRDVEILFATIGNQYYRYYAFLNPVDHRYYDHQGRSLTGEMIVSPLSHYKITSPFGMRYHPILHRWRMHEGVDLVARIGAPVKAVASGVVIYKGWMGGYGRTVKIKHRGGYVTLYAHLKGWGHIRKGSYVHAGQVIGYLGSSGLSTGPHLHFGVMYHHRWINPFRFKGKEAKYVLRGKAKQKFIAYIRKFLREQKLAYLEQKLFNQKKGRD
ncbi:MAG: peptidoglycan DD-metalloendopeptidase family protein [Campylobacterales bacterium]